MSDQPRLTPEAQAALDAIRNGRAIGINDVVKLQKLGREITAAPGTEPQQPPCGILERIEARLERIERLLEQR